MTAQKRHPFQTAVDRVLTQADLEGIDNITDRELTVLGFHWLSVVGFSNGRRSKRQWAAILTAATTAISAAGTGIAFGVTTALGG